MNYTCIKYKSQLNASRLHIKAGTMKTTIPRELRSHLLCMTHISRTVRMVPAKKSTPPNDMRENGYSPKQIQDDKSSHQATYLVATSTLFVTVLVKTTAGNSTRVALRYGQLLSSLSMGHPKRHTPRSRFLCHLQLVQWFQLGILQGRHIRLHTLHRPRNRVPPHPLR